MLQPRWDGSAASKMEAEEYVAILAKYSTVANE
jgi:hypothetical protein